MATVVHSPTAAVVAVIVGSLSTACSDVVVDSIVVERSRGAPQVHPSRFSYPPLLVVRLASSHYTEDLSMGGFQPRK